MHNETINRTIRNTIAAQGSKLVSVQAVKKDGTRTRFVFSAATNRKKVAAIVTASGAQAAETAAMNNPDMVRVWCYTRKRWAQFDCNRVLSMSSAGNATQFRLHREF